MNEIIFRKQLAIFVGAALTILSLYTGPSSAPTL